MVIYKKSPYLSMAELARRLELPESTLRYYCARFAAFLPCKGEGRKRRYAPETESTLVFIAGAMRRGKNAMVVELMLQSGQYHALPAPTEERPPGQGSEQTLAPLPEAQPPALERIAAALELLAANLVPRQPARTGPEQTWSSELEALKKELRDMERLHQEDLAQLRKWLGKIGEALGEKRG